MIAWMLLENHLDVVCVYADLLDFKSNRRKYYNVLMLSKSPLLCLS